jgi:DUF4097 and DUF4098 domain-containing protein YvlB
MRTAFLSAAMFSATLLMTGCDIEDFGPSDRYKEDFHYSYNLQPGNRFSIDNMNGSVEISGWDQNKVEISGTKYAATEDLLKSVKIDIQADSGAVRVRTARPSGPHGGHCGARYVVHVPMRTELDRVESTNGSIRVENIEGRGRITTTNGAVRTMKYRGGLDARTTNGSIDASDIVGPVSVRTSNGTIKLDAVRGDVDAETSNGRIEARLAGADSNRPLRFQTSNGSINVAVESLKSSDVRASTTNGTITVKLPSGTGARVQARTTNSSVSSEFDVTQRGASNKHRLDGTIGSGGPLLDLSSTNGNIKIQRM